FIRGGHMTKNWSAYVLAAMLLGSLTIHPTILQAAGDHPGDHKGSETHQKHTGVVTKGSGEALVVKSDDGATFQISPNLSKRQSQAGPKEGDQVTFTLD